MRPEELRHLAALARLDLDPDEVPAFGRQMAEIVAFCGELEHFAAAEPGAGDVEAVEADDLPVAGLERSTVLDNVPRHAGGFMVVPRTRGES
ncbi:MAG: Asp-tRNA(Asn)/Glu-tRNA(Gln) amidotransferase subunit GatC [Acidobacteriota bacterium]